LRLSRSMSSQSPTVGRSSGPSGARRPDEIESSTPSPTTLTIPR
jgi:hypothetical protein